MGKGLNLGRFYRWAGKNGWRGVEQEAGGFRKRTFPYLLQQISTCPRKTHEAKGQKEEKETEGDLLKD